MCVTDPTSFLIGYRIVSPEQPCLAQQGGIPSLQFRQTLRESTNQIKVFQFENGRFQTKGIVAGRTWLTGMDLFPPAPLNLPGAVPTPGSSQVTSFQGRWKRR